MINHHYILTMVLIYGAVLKFKIIMTNVNNMKNILLIAMLMLVGFVSCSDDKSGDEPQNLTEQSKYMSQEEFNSKIANRLWKLTWWAYYDDEGNEMPDMEGIGGLPPEAYCFTSKGTLCFTGNFFTVYIANQVYNSRLGWICRNDEIYPRGDYKILGFEEGKLKVQTEWGRWNAGPDCPFRDDVSKVLTLTEVENPDWEWWFRVYPPELFNPDDLGLY